MLAASALAVHDESTQQRYAQLDSLQAEVDALTGVEALLERVSLTPPAATSNGQTQRSLAEEEEQLAVIAQLDAILASLQTTAADVSQQSNQKPQPTQETDADEDDLTFLTQLTRSGAPRDTADRFIEDDSQSLSIDGAVRQLDSHEPADEFAATEPVAPVPSQSLSNEAPLSDGEGFRLSRSEAERVAAIDALLTAVAAEERQGKKRRFVHIRSSAQSRQRAQAGVDENRASNLPRLVKAPGRSQPTRYTPPQAPLIDSTAAQAPNHTSLPLADDYCVDERRRLSAVESELALLAAPPTHSLAGDECVHEWLPLEAAPQADAELAATPASKLHACTRLPAEQSWLYVQSLRDLYTSSASSHWQAQHDDEASPLGWLDAAEADGSEEGAEQLDSAIERDSILPDTDNEEEYEQGQEQGREEKQQTSSALAWQRIKRLPAAPSSPKQPNRSPQLDERLFEAASSDSAIDGADLEGRGGSAALTLEARERHAAASSDAARRRVRRLLVEAEQRKQTVRQPAADGAHGHSAGVKAPTSSRVRTSEERDASAVQRKTVGVLAMLPQRPPTR